MGKAKGSRLLAARQLRGRTLADVASWLDVTPQAISRMEKSIVDYSRYLEYLSVKFALPPTFFEIDDIEIVPTSRLSFRAKRSLTARTKDSVSAKASLAADLDIRLIRYSVKPDPLPDLPRTNIEYAAETLRLSLGFGYSPVHDLLSRIESLGVRVYWYHDPSESTFGVSFWSDGVPFIMLNSIERSRERDNWTLAHELGHLCLHRDLSSDSLQSEDCEKEANLFASSFLMPEATFVPELPAACVLDYYFRLKKRWGVSAQAMLFRAHSLKRISRWQYEDSFKRINARGWRKKEPGDTEPQESIFLYSIFEKMSRNQVDLKDMLWKDLGMPSDIVNELTLVYKYFESEQAEGGLFELP